MANRISEGYEVQFRCLGDVISRASIGSKAVEGEKENYLPWLQLHSGTESDV